MGRRDVSTGNAAMSPEDSAERCGKRGGSDINLARVDALVLPRHLHVSNGDNRTSGLPRRLNREREREREIKRAKCGSYRG